MERRAFLKASALSAGGLAAAPVASASSPLRVQVLMFDGVEEQDFAGPVEVLGLVGKMTGRVVVSQVTTGRPAVVTCTYGTRVDVRQGWSPRDADVLVVPGGGYTDRTGPGVHRVNADRRFLAALASAEALPVGVCTGVMVLSAAGLTKGRPATTHSGAKADLAAQGATVVDARVVDDGTLITAGGITSGLDAALWVVERFLGAQAAQRAETVLEYERRGTVWRKS
ncbi:DJ-1/PfpI family protein [Actinosynnema sp. NPDC020468]|uniref:DJ-1/PfpI family protein n=1 Tax=Actinosynnema sp. NPDC020468 TaxID=3154488 RepID=UPI0033FB7747